MAWPQCPERTFHKGNEEIYTLNVLKTGEKVYVCQCGCKFTVGYLDNGSVDPFCWEIIKRGRHVNN
jgi:hypothetical protein